MDFGFEFLVSYLVVFLASTVQSTVGFGFALVAVPLLTFIWPIKEIVPIVVVYGFIINIMVVFTIKNYIQLNKICTMIVSGIIGIPIGVYGLKSLNPEALKVIIGILILITSIAMAKGYKVKFKRIKTSYGVAGLLSGVLNGSLSMSGPPIVLFLSNEGYDKNEFRANLAMYGIVNNSLTILAFILSGLLRSQMAETITVNLLPLFIGGAIGIFVASKIAESYFRKIVLFSLSMIGVATVTNVIF